MFVKFELIFKKLSLKMLKASLEDLNSLLRFKIKKSTAIFLAVKCSDWLLECCYLVARKLL